MSLINKMLQDLEARQAGGAERILTDHVRPLPAGTNPRRARVVAAVALTALLLAVAGALQFLPSREGPVVARPVNADPAPPAPAAASIAVPAAPLVASVVPVTQSASPDQIPPAAPPESPRRIEAIGLKVATELVVPPSVQARSEPRSVAARPSPPEENAAPAPKRPRPSEGPTRIEKSNRVITAQERAANDYRHALALLNEGRASASIDSLRAALQSDALLTEARLLLSSLFLEKRQIEEARSVLQEGLARDPAQPRLAMPLARIQVELGDSGGAAETLSRAAQAASGNAEFRGFHAAVLQRLGRHEEATAEFRAALRLVPESGLWWMGLGISLEADGQRGSARDALRRARETGRLTPELDRFVEQKLLALP